METEPLAHSLQSLAEEIDVDLDDLLTVANIELTDEEFDPDTETVNEEGKRLLVQHFNGGVDPT